MTVTFLGKLLTTHWLLLFLLLTGCLSRTQYPAEILQPSATFTPFQPIPRTLENETPQPAQNTSPEPVEVLPVPEITQPAPSPTINPNASPAPQPGLRLWLPPYIPAGLRESLLLPPPVALSDNPEDSELRLVTGAADNTVQWLFALASPFPTLVDEVSFNHIQQAWWGEPSGHFSGQPLLVDENTSALFSELWGQRDPDNVHVLPAGELLEYAWNNQPAWALLPFEALEPRWKVIEVDGQSPLWKNFDPARYPLLVDFSLQSDQFGQDYLIEASRALGLPASNRQPEKLTTLILTGVTAMVRCTARTMDRSGITYPADIIRDVLVEADITHISNEIPFTPDCPQQSCLQEGLVFCSLPAYIELMENIGTDIVELTGDHFADWGPEAMLYTLQLYREREWSYYGGGENIDEARQPLLIEHNGNRLAFLGCNAKALQGYATAAENVPGAVRCEWGYLQEEISRLRREGYLPVVTYQHEEYYRYSAAPNLENDFRRAAEAGALIVSGSQAHQPHGMEFYSGAFLHYGLGNLFFDQFGYCPGDACDDAFIDRHVFYNGKYIGLELLPIKFVDYARSRWMTEEEKNRFLEIIFSASGW
jgi:hypothetical protein